MKIIVCIKQVPDPSASSSGTTVDSEAKRVIPPQGTPPVMNPYDENALEAALRIKEAHGARVTVISAGKNIAKTVLRKSLAVGADDLILLDDNAFDKLDSYATAHVLAAAIRQAGDYDLILCGRQAADTDAGQVGSGNALRLPAPLRVTCQVIGSLTLLWVVSTWLLRVNWPTAPLKPAGASGGNGFTSSVTGCVCNRWPELKKPPGMVTCAGSMVSWPTLEGKRVVLNSVTL